MADDIRDLADKCPVCGKHFLPAKIAEHVEHHLANDVIELRIGGNRPGLYIDGHYIRTG